MQNKMPQSAAAAFVGTWELESFTEIVEDGSFIEPMGSNPRGFLLYTTEGMVSAQLTGSDHGQAAGQSEKSNENNGSPSKLAPYIAYCGSFSVDDKLHQVVHIPLVAYDRQLVGQRMHRKFEFDADRLTLRTLAGESGANVLEARLVWRRH
jgi:hypothetical protein